MVTIGILASPRTLESTCRVQVTFVRSCADMRCVSLLNEKLQREFSQTCTVGKIIKPQLETYETYASRLFDNNRQLLIVHLNPAVIVGVE